MVCLLEKLLMIIKMIGDSFAFSRSALKLNKQCRCHLTKTNSALENKNKQILSSFHNGWQENRRAEELRVDMLELRAHYNLTVTQQQYSILLRLWKTFYTFVSKYSQTQIILSPYKVYHLTSVVSIFDKLKSCQTTPL